MSKYLEFEEEGIKQLDEAVAKVPEVFRLPAFGERTFRIKKSKCFIGRTGPQLVLEDIELGEEFSRSDASEVIALAIPVKEK